MQAEGGEAGCDRDDLLTALIIDSYHALADRVEHAISGCPETDHEARWLAACHAVRQWASARVRADLRLPDRGLPRTPRHRRTRVASAVCLARRRPRRLAGRLADVESDVELSPAMTAQLDRVAELTGVGEVSRPTLEAVLIAWTQLFGMVSFELFGHFTGVFDDTTTVFEHVIRQLANLIGFRLDERPAAELDKPA